MEEPAIGGREAEGVSDTAIGGKDGIKAEVVEGVDRDGTEEAEAGGKGEEAVGRSSGGVEAVESGAQDIVGEGSAAQGVERGGEASPDLAGSKPVGAMKAGEDRLGAGMAALPEKVVEAVAGRIEGLLKAGSVRVEGVAGLATNVEGVSVCVNRLDGRVVGVANFMMKMVPEIRGMFKGELDPLTTTLMGGIEELKAELPKLKGGEAVKMEQAAGAVEKAGLAISAELVGYRADFQEWREKQQDRRKWLLMAVGVVGTPGLVALGIFVQLQFGLVAVADPSNGWRDIVWSGYGRQVAVCMQNARKSGSPVRCALKVAP